jgi:chitodextrinase
MTVVERARALRPIIEQAAKSLPDDIAETAVELFPEWVTAHAYSVGDRCRYLGLLYRCVQAHTSQADWTPDKTPGSFVRTSTDDWPARVQPTGAHDAYNKGDKVSHNKKHYISDIDANVWEPPTMWTEAE